MIVAVMIAVGFIVGVIPFLMVPRFMIVGGGLSRWRSCCWLFRNSFRSCRFRRSRFRRRCLLAITGGGHAGDDS